MDLFGLMDLFEAVRLQDTWKHCQIHYEMIAKGFLRAFVLVIGSGNR